MDEEITMTRSELLEFLGKVALPPFNEHPEASRWDCAPMARDLILEVENLFSEKNGGPTYGKLVVDKEKV